MTWTTPKTWQTSDMLTADLMNEQLRDNLNHLANYSSSIHAEQTTTTTSGSYGNIGTPITLTATKDHMYLSFYVRVAPGPTYTEGNFGAKISVEVAGTTVYSDFATGSGAAGSYGSGSNGTKYVSVSFGGRIECLPGDSVVITGEVAGNGFQSRDATGHFGGLSHV